MADAVTLVTDFKPREELIRAGVVEATMQFLDAFNQGSNGAVRVIDASLEGNWNKTNFFQLPASFIERRDPTANGDVDTKKVTESQFVGVKVNRRAGPVDFTLDSFKKINAIANPQSDTYNFYFGQETGRRVLQDKLNTALIGLRAAVDGQASLKFTAAGALTTSDLFDGMAKFGDAAGEIVAWVMHSKPYFSLVKDQAITNQVTGLASTILSGGGAATIGKPVIVTDSTSLITGSGSTTQYHTLGLTRDALIVTNSEPMTMQAVPVNGFDNIRILWQGEYAYNIDVRGYAFSTSGGDANPSDSTLGTSSKWTLAVSDKKNSAGILIESTG